MVLPSSLPVAHEMLERIGRLSAVQFVDMQANALVRPYNNYIQRIEEMERIIRFLHEEIRCLELATAATRGGDTAPLVVKAPKGGQSFLENGKGYILDRVEEALSRLYAQFVLFKGNNTNLQNEKNAALEEQCVLQVAVQQLRVGGAGGNTLYGQGPGRGFSGGPPAGGPRGDFQEDTEDIEDGRNLLFPQSGDEFMSLSASSKTGENAAVSAVAGMIALQDIPRFQRTLFRSTRGNAFSFFQPTDQKFTDPKTGADLQKNVFVVYHQGSTQSLLHEKIKRVCLAFNGHCYQWPSTLRQAKERLDALTDVIRDKEKALAAYENYFLGEISTLLDIPREGSSSLIEEWRMFCQKEKAIYAALNCFEGRDMTLRCSCWIPKAKEESVRMVLKSMKTEGDEQGSAFLLTEKQFSNAMPPTFFKSTEFTDPSQMLVDTYGVPRYQEANPAFLASVTFPFLFGVMYGDIGHGGIVFLLGLYLLFFSDYLKKNGGMFASFVPYRYLLALMGFFAFYAGFLYNDLFALGVDIFGTTWTEDGHEEINGGIRLRRIGEKTYPFGVDPAWKGATNELLMMNSIKMKLSVLIAVVHMGVGVLLKGLNAIHFKDKLDFFFEFIPQFIFLMTLIGYMNFMVLYKWVTPLTHNKPNLISAIINMCMMGEVTPDEELYPNQQTVERVLLVLIVLTVPVMFLVKPTILLLKSKQKKASSKKIDMASGDHDPEAGSNNDHNSGLAHHQSSGAGGGQGDEHEDAGAGDLYIFQMIETIEFVLGTISNTASYLRLWALSLAHQQLSLVFYSQTVVRALTMSDSTALVAVVLFFVFALFAFITFGVILCMDLLEVSLHALRLQWVEFQNKFFKGDGYKFDPLDFLAVVKPKAS
ncbi:vacuolar proton-translocating ATPase [Cyclospora cayetanensis]|uniref:V-type proton ATPase subunit a n=1 Tax=Cyclospora cayetanensis TaxID=88456 RepID=A0A1D3DAF1_9EIME|nr:vacuolar proton-translocating ATPase [Cyclospora cayetanensis]